MGWRRFKLGPQYLNHHLPTSRYHDALHGHASACLIKDWATTNHPHRSAPWWHSKKPNLVGDDASSYHRRMRKRTREHMTRSHAQARDIAGPSLVTHPTHTDARFQPHPANTIEECLPYVARACISTASAHQTQPSSRAALPPSHAHNTTKRKDRLLRFTPTEVDDLSKQQHHDSLTPCICRQVSASFMTQTHYHPSHPNQAGA